MGILWSHSSYPPEGVRSLECQLCKTLLDVEEELLIPGRLSPALLCQDHRL